MKQNILFTLCRNKYISKFLDIDTLNVFLKIGKKIEIFFSSTIPNIVFNMIFRLFYSLRKKSKHAITLYHDSYIKLF